MLDIINPWGALRRANEKIAELEADIEDLHEECNDYFEGYKEACERLDKAQILIAQGHFRNPKTGCIGPKGKTFK
jgi:hypothetical protein